MAHNKDFNFNLDLPSTHESSVDKQLLLDHARNQIEKVANTYHKDFPEYMQAKILTVYPNNLFDLASLDETKIWYSVPCILPGASQYFQPQQVVHCRFYSVDTSRPYIKGGLGLSSPMLDLSAIISPTQNIWARQSQNTSRSRSRLPSFRYHPATFTNLPVRPYIARTADDEVYLTSMLNKGDHDPVLEPPNDVGINRCTSKVTRVSSNGAITDVTVSMEIHTMVLSAIGILVVGKQWYLGLPGQSSFQSTAVALYDFSLNLVWLQGPYLQSPSHELFTGVLDCEPILRDGNIYMLAETVDISEPPMEMIVLSAATGEFIARYPWIYKNYPTRLLANTGDVDGVFATIDAGTIGSEQAYYKFLVQAFVGGRWQHNGYSYAQVTG